MLLKENVLKALDDLYRELFMSESATQEECRNLRLGVLRALYTVKEMPTVDAEPVRHGKWIEIVTHNGCTPDYDCVCSLCESSGAPIDDYCRGCGAKMDGE
jgi:hypothetical protein